METARRLAEAGASIVLTACTEIPLVLGRERVGRIPSSGSHGGRGGRLRSRSRSGESRSQGNADPDRASMREADRRTIEEVGIPGVGPDGERGTGGGLDHAGADRGPRLSLRRRRLRQGRKRRRRTGRASHARRLGYDARAVVLAPFESLSPDALDNLQAALKLGLTVESTPTVEAWDEVLAQIAVRRRRGGRALRHRSHRAAAGLFQRVIEDLELAR